jgi:gingipain K
MKYLTCGKPIFLFSIAACMLCLSIPGVLGFDEEMELSSFFPDEGFFISTVTNDLDREVVISVEVTDLKIDSITIGGTEYSTISIDEAGCTMSPGKPVLPMIGKLYHVSDTLAPEVSVRIIESHTETLPHPVLPSQIDQEVQDILRIESLDRKLYSNQEWYPAQRIITEDPVAMRDVRLQPVAYYPVRYNPAGHVIDVADKAEIVIRMVERETPNTIASHGPYSSSWEVLYKALVPNYSDGWIGDRNRNLPEHYLFIMPDEFEARCQGFFAWKEQQGFIIDVIRLSELGSNPSHSDVKTAISQYYQSEASPAYASIIGSTNNFPIHESHDNYMSGDFDDDLYYSQLEGGDYFPDIFLSRYPAVDPDELSIMLSKILFYEQTPQMENTEYYKTALMACSGLYSSQQYTKEQTADRLTLNLGYETIHTMYDWYTGAVTQVQNWINSGVSIINYRGEGWQAGWHPGHSYDFEYPEVYACHNGNMFPVITSIGCGVAMFDGYSECFGHAWMVHGSLQNKQGAVAFMGPTWNTRTTINNWIDRGLYRGFCYHNITRSSPVFNYGKFYAYEHFLGTEYMINDIPTHVREYVLFGNPDMW